MKVSDPGGYSQAVSLTAKDRLIRAAEELFAQKGFDATSLREISVLAGQKNKNAVQYHFVDKKGLITAIWQRHALTIEKSRSAMLASVDPAAEMELDFLVQSIVLPIAYKLNDNDGGRHYIQIMSHLISYSGMSLIELFDYIPDITSESIMKSVEPYAGHLSRSQKMSRMVLVAGLIFHGLADFIRLTEERSQLKALLDQEEYLRNLMGLVKAAFLIR